jgi:CBS domain-containing protein
MKVEDLMTKDVIVVPPTASLKQVAGVLADGRISGLPVVEEGRLVGVVSEADILYKESGREAPAGGFLGWLLLDTVVAEEKLAARTAGDAMTAPAVTIGPERPAHEAASRMIEWRINRLPVVDEHGTLVGIVTRNDLVRAFTRGDAEIARDVREDVLLRTFAVAPEAIHVRVSEGEVSIRGHVETKLQADSIPRFVERIPGVVGVDAELTWAGSR